MSTHKERDERAELLASITAHAGEALEMAVDAHRQEHNDGVLTEEILRLIREIQLDARDLRKHLEAAPHAPAQATAEDWRPALVTALREFALREDDAALSHRVEFLTDDDGSQFGHTCVVLLDVVGVLRRRVRTQCEEMLGLAHTGTRPGEFALFADWLAGLLALMQRVVAASAQVARAAKKGEHSTPSST